MTEQLSTFTESFARAKKYVLIERPQVNSKRKEEKMWRWQKYSKIRKSGNDPGIPLLSKQLSIEVQLICDVADAPQSDPVIHTDAQSVSDSFPSEVVTGSRYTSLSHTVGPCCLSVLCLVRPVSVNPKFLIDPSPTFPFGNHVFFYVYESVL